MPLGPYTNFRGQPVDATSILLAYTRTGDANLDGLVNDEDVTIVSATYAPGVPQPHWALGDFDYNGFVDDDDVTLLGAFYNSPTNAVAPAPSTPAYSGPVSWDDDLIDRLAHAIIGDSEHSSANLARRRSLRPQATDSVWARAEQFQPDGDFIVLN